MPDIPTRPSDIASPVRVAVTIVLLILAVTVLLLFSACNRTPAAGTEEGATASALASTGHSG